MDTIRMFHCRYGAVAFRFKSFDEDTRCRGRSRRETGKVEKLTSLGLQESQPPNQKWFDRRRMTGDMFIAHPSWTSAISITPSFAKELQQIQGEESCSGRTTVGTVQYLRSKTHQLCKWQRQESWIFPDSVALVCRCTCSEVPRFLRLPEKRAPTSVHTPAS